MKKKAIMCSHCGFKTRFPYTNCYDEKVCLICAHTCNGEYKHIRKCLISELKRLLKYGGGLK